MRKYMNNHFGQSRIFGHAYFRVPPMESGDGGLENNGDLGGGSSEESTTNNDDGNGNDNGGEDVEALKAELAKAKADALRFKNSNDKLLKEKGELTKKNREMMSADQLAQEAQKEREEKFNEMAKELRVNRYSKRLVGLGMSESDADTFAATIPEMEDSDAFFTTLGSFIQAKVKEASDNAVQELLKNRPEINAGNGDADKDDPAMAFAKRAVAQRKAENGDTHNNILKHYIH